MVCSYCSTPNPETNRFCGECGQPLVRQQVTVPAEFGSDPAPRFHREETTISGPSFLGLTDSDDDRTDYLLEDERPHRSHTGWVVFSLIVLVLLGGVGWLEWNAIKTGQIQLPWVKSTAPASGQATENASATPASSESAVNPSDQNPQAEGASESGTMVTNDTDAKPTGSESRGDAAEGTHPSGGTSDAEATRAAQSRIASDAGNRRAQADAGKSEDNADDNSNEPQTEKPSPKTTAVRTTAPKAPDPRQDRMVVAGEKYLYGRGVPQDCNQALVYFRAAAEKQNGPAMSHLGAMYASGHCVTQNKVAAYKWFSRASESEPSNQWISRSMNMLWRDMSPQERASVAR